MARSNNRVVILQVALELFATRGYDATGVQEIADAAGVGKPTLYHYFGNKQGLLATLVDEASADFLARLAAAAAYDRNLPNTLLRVVAEYLGFAAREPVFYRLMLSLLFVPPENEAHEAASAVLTRMESTLELLFSEAARDHGNMRGRHEQYAQSLLGVLAGYGLLLVNGRLQFDPQLCRAIVQQFSHGIYS